MISHNQIPASFGWTGTIRTAHPDRLKELSRLVDDGPDKGQATLE